MREGEQEERGRKLEAGVGGNREEKETWRARKGVGEGRKGRKGGQGRNAPPLIPRGWRPGRYHSHHHASFVTEAITGSVHPFLEHVGYTANFAIPLLGTWAMGGASWAMFYSYLLVRRMPIPRPSPFFPILVLSCPVDPPVPLGSPGG